MPASARSRRVSSQSLFALPAALAAATSSRLRLETEGRGGVDDGPAVRDRFVGDDAVEIEEQRLGSQNGSEGCREAVEIAVVPRQGGPQQRVELAAAGKAADGDAEGGHRVADPRRVGEPGADEVPLRRQGIGAELGEGLDEIVALRPDPIDPFTRRFGVGCDGLLENIEGQPRNREGLADPPQPVHDPGVADGVTGPETGAAPRLGEGPDEHHIGVVQRGSGEVELGVAELAVGLIVEHQGPRQAGHQLGELVARDDRAGGVVGGDQIEQDGVIAGGVADVRPPGTDPATTPRS